MLLPEQPLSRVEEPNRPVGRAGREEVLLLGVEFPVPNVAGVARRGRLVLDVNVPADGLDAALSVAVDDDRLVPAADAEDALVLGLREGNYCRRKSSGFGQGGRPRARPLGRSSWSGSCRGTPRAAFGSPASRWPDGSPGGQGPGPRLCLCGLGEAPRGRRGFLARRGFIWAVVGIFWGSFAGIFPFLLLIILGCFHLRRMRINLIDLNLVLALAFIAGFSILVGRLFALALNLFPFLKNCQFLCEIFN